MENKILIFSTMLMLFLFLGYISNLCMGEFEDDITKYEILLETSFEEEWELDIDGDYFAPSGWNVEGICKGNHLVYNDLGHYWYNLHEDDDHTCTINISKNGNVAATVWWSDGNNESQDIGRNQDEWLITPKLDFTNYSQIELEFWTRNKWGINYGYSCNVKISTDGGNSYKNIVNLVNDSEWFKGGQISEDSNWYEYPINLNLSEYAGSDNVKIAWQYYYNESYGIPSRASWGIDDVKIFGIYEKSLDEDLIDGQNGDTSESTPGFEIILAVIAVALLVLFKKKIVN